MERKRWAKLFHSLGQDQLVGSDPNRSSARQNPFCHQAVVLNAAEVKWLGEDAHVEQIGWHDPLGLGFGLRMGSLSSTCIRLPLGT